MAVSGNISVDALCFSTVHLSPFLLFLPQTIILDRHTVAMGDLKDVFYRCQSFSISSSCLKGKGEFWTVNAKYPTSQSHCTVFKCCSTFEKCSICRWWNGMFSLQLNRNDWSEPADRCWLCCFESLFWTYNNAVTQNCIGLTYLQTVTHITYS